MKIKDLLFFAPGIPFDKVDLQGDALHVQYQLRMTGFYIEPAEVCADCGHAFAAGTLLVACIDAMARLRYRDDMVRRRFIKLAQEELRSFEADALAVRFYKDFRNGIVHEGRVKNGGQFSFEVDETAKELQGVLLINPARLVAEVREALDRYVNLLGTDQAQRQALVDGLAQDHKKDFLVAKGAP